MTLTSVISPLSSWLRRWQCMTNSPVKSSKLHAQRQRAGLDDGFLRAQGRRRHVGVVDVPHFRPGLETRGRIEIMRDLEVVDVDVDRMLVVVVVDELPLFDRAEPRLEQGHVGKCDAVERVDEGLGIGCAGEIVDEAAGDGELALDVGRDLGDVLEHGCRRRAFAPRRTPW